MWPEVLVNKGKDLTGGDVVLLHGKKEKKKGRKAAKKTI